MAALTTEDRRRLADVLFRSADEDTKSAERYREEARLLLEGSPSSTSTGAMSAEETIREFLPALSPSQVECLLEGEDGSPAANLDEEDAIAAQISMTAAAATLTSDEPLPPRPASRGIPPEQI